MMDAHFFQKVHIYIYLYLIYIDIHDVYTNMHMYRMYSYSPCTTSIMKERSHISVPAGTCEYDFPFSELGYLRVPSKIPYIFHRDHGWNAVKWDICS